VAVEQWCEVPTAMELNGGSAQAQREGERGVGGAMRSGGGRLLL
jgi:hypothetical protein